MHDPNLPDDCQGSGSHLPWNQEDAPECPRCGSENYAINANDKHCFDAECTDCGYTEYWDDFD